jgi:hypothetical protein
MIVIINKSRGLANRACDRSRSCAALIAELLGDPQRVSTIRQHALCTAAFKAAGGGNIVFI